MIRTESPPQTTTIPLIKDNELRLAKMRRQLEGMFNHLRIAHDEISVSADAARSEGLAHVANVLDMAVGNRLWGQLKALKDVIERLGGTAELSEEAKIDGAAGGGAES